MTSNPHITAPSDPIPVEVYSNIILYLARPALVRCCRVSKGMCPIAAARLYTTVVFPGIEENDETGVLQDDLPKWVRRGKMDIGGLPKAHQTKIRAYLRDHISHTSTLLTLPKRNQPNLNPSHTSLPVPHRFSFVKHLTLHGHHHSICDDLLPLPINNLLSLRISAGRQIALCRCQHKQRGNTCSATPPCMCPLVTRLQPRQLILGAEETNFTGSASSLWGSSSPPPSLKEIVFIVGAYSDEKDGRDPTKTFLDKLPNTIEKLTLVMWTWQGEWLKDEPWGPGGTLASWERRFRPHMLRGGLALACCGKSKVVEVVGLETIMAGWKTSPAKVKKEIGELRKEIKKQLVKKGWKADEADARAQAVRFIEGKTYAAGGGGEGVKEAVIKGREVVRGVILKDWLDIYGHERTEEDEI